MVGGWTGPRFRNRWWKARSPMLQGHSPYPLQMEMTANSRTQSFLQHVVTQVALNGQLITGDEEGNFTSEQASLFQERMWVLELVRPGFRSCHLQALQTWAHGLPSLSLGFLISNMGLVSISIYIKKKICQVLSPYYTVLGDTPMNKTWSQIS